LKGSSEKTSTNRTAPTAPSKHDGGREPAEPPPDARRSGEASPAADVDVNR
jgi:hypothetical protein